MGAVYSVDMKLDYNDEKAIVNALNKFIDDNHGKGMVFSLDEYSQKGYSRDTLDDIVKYFITDRGFGKNGPGEYYADFDASYGWETVMQDMFESIAPLLKDGSYMSISPDNDSYTGTVKGGKVEWEDD